MAQRLIIVVYLNAEFYVKHPNIIYMSNVDVLKKVQQTAYVAMNCVSQRQYV